MDGNTCVLIRVGPPLGWETVLLVRHGFSSVEIAVLENTSSISKDKINCTINVAFSVELPHGVYVERILVADETAFVEC